MSAPKQVAKGIKAINDQGLLLVYPLNNQPDPASLWSVLHPRTAMRWEWDDGGDNRVADLWHLRSELFSSRKVVYAKWFQGRATFMSRELYPALLATLAPGAPGAPASAAASGASRLRAGLGADARAILSALEGDSPLSTKELRKAAGMTGKLQASTYERAMKELWSRLLIVGCGEVDDGAFPSLAVGAASVIFEDLVEEAATLDPARARSTVVAALKGKPAFARFYARATGRAGTDTGARGSKKATAKGVRAPAVIDFNTLVK